MEKSRDTMLSSRQWKFLMFKDHSIWEIVSFFILISGLIVLFIAAMVGIWSTDSDLSAKIAMTGSITFAAGILSLLFNS